MQSDVPIVNLTFFGEPFYLTDYIQTCNPLLKQIANDEIKTRDTDATIKAVAQWVANHLEYPLDFKGRPTASQIAKAFRWFADTYLVETPNDLRDYSWRFPNQTVTVKKGMCFDSACVCTSLLHIKGVEAFTVLGGVLKTRNKELLGLHAWTEAKNSRGEWVIIETTVHPEPAELVGAKELYNGKYSVTYDPFVWFNEASYVEDKKKVALYESLIEEMM